MNQLSKRLVLAAVCCTAFAQDVHPSNAAQAGPALVRLSPASYPPIALAARVAGTVELSILLRRDGILESLEIVSGPPMLRQAASDSAKASQFECNGCIEANTALRLTYKYELDWTRDCTDSVATARATAETSYPRVTHSAQVVTIVGQPIPTCDPASDIIRVRSRSAKCLFLWRCGWK
jgi:hypothetical protein